MPIKLPIHPATHDRSGGLDLFDADGKWFVYCSSTAPQHATAEERAHLIVHAVNAVPDLIEALRQLHDDTAEYCRVNKLCGWDNQVMQIARAAIEKATGETVPVPEGQMRHSLD